MFRNMRRFKQQLSQEESIDILKRGTSGVLAVLGDDGFPYAVPLSYAYMDGKIIFHSAKAGHKIDAIKQHEKVSFCVIDQDQIVPDEYTTYFRSVIVFGRIHIIDNDDAIRCATSQLAEKYRPDYEEERNAEIAKGLPQLCVFELEIEHMTGKEAVELMKAKMHSSLPNMNQ